MSNRRSRGEGMIRKRSDGRYEGRYTDSTGKRRYVYGATRAIAHDLLTAGLRQTQQGVIGSPQLTGTFLNSWITDTVRPTLRPRTYERYAGIVTKYLVPSLGNVPLARLTPQHVARLHAQLAGMHPATLSYVHAVLRSALAQAVEWRLIERNPASLVKPPRIPHQEMQSLNRDQVHTFLDAVAGDALEALFVLAVTSGMRLGELLGLQWNALDLSEGTAHVQRSLTRVQHEWWLTEPKTSSSRRAVALTDRAVTALQAHRVQQARDRIAAGPGWTDHNLVFTDDWGEPLFGSHITERRLRPILRRAGLPSIRFHDLRHTAATLLLSAGVNPRIAATMLGHSSVQITLDRYSHVSDTMVREAARRIDDALA